MLPEDQLKLIGCLLASIPFSYMLSCIRKPAVSLALSCTVSLIMQLIIFQQWIYILWFQQNIVFLLCKYTNRTKVGKLVFIQTFILLCIIQIIRMYLSYGVQHVDITAIFMMQVFQYISFSYNYQDGANKQKNKDNKYIIQNLPSHVQYLGYVMFIPSCLVGPVFQFNDYHHYLHKTGIYSAIRPNFTPPAMLKQLKTTIFSIAVYFLLLPFPLSFMLTPQYTEYNYLMQIVYLLISIMGARFKYYAAWSLGMVGVHASGLTFNPKVNQFNQISNSWDRIVVSNIWDFQMEPSMKKKADGWNIPIQIALKRYVYDRVYQPSEQHTHKQKKKLQIQAQQKTLAVSALWHGLYIGYFLAFFHWGLLLQVSQELYRIQQNSPKLKKWRHKLKYVQLIIINYFLEYFGVCFQFMTWEKIKIFFAASWYIPVIIIYLANIIVVRLGLFSKNIAKHKHTNNKSQGNETPQNKKSL